MNRPYRIVRRTLAGLALLSLAACGSPSAKPSSAGIPPTSTNPVTSPVTPPPVANQVPTTDEGSGLTPADGPAPASGICGRVGGALVVVTANPDTPSPRCVVVNDSQRLKVVNASDQSGEPGKSITVIFASFPPRKVAVGAATTFDQSFGSYLAPGVHDLHISLYSGSAAVWLR